MALAKWENVDESIWGLGAIFHLVGKARPLRQIVSQIYSEFLDWRFFFYRKNGKLLQMNKIATQNVFPRTQEIGGKKLNTY